MEIQSNIALGSLYFSVAVQFTAAGWINVGWLVDWRRREYLSFRLTSTKCNEKVIILFLRNNAIGNFTFVAGISCWCYVTANSISTLTSLLVTTLLFCSNCGRDLRATYTFHKEMFTFCIIRKIFVSIFESIMWGWTAIMRGWTAIMFLI